MSRELGKGSRNVPEFQAKLKRARDAIAKWELEEGSTDWRLYVVQHDFENHPRGTHPAGGFLTVKFLTRHVTLGDLNEPRRHRTPRLANPATTRPRAPRRKGVCTRANSPSTNN